MYICHDIERYICTMYISSSFFLRVFWPWSLTRIRRCKAASRPTTSWWRCSASDFDLTFDEIFDVQTSRKPWCFFLGLKIPKKTEGVSRYCRFFFGWTKKAQTKDMQCDFQSLSYWFCWFFELNQTVTPLKINMDGQNDGLGNVSPFKYNHFWYQC